MVCYRRLYAVIQRPHVFGNFDPLTNLLTKTRHSFHKCNFFEVYHKNPYSYVKNPISHPNFPLLVIISMPNVLYFLIWTINLRLFYNFIWQFPLPSPPSDLIDHIFVLFCLVLSLLFKWVILAVKIVNIAQLFCTPDWINNSWKWNKDFGMFLFETSFHVTQNKKKSVNTDVRVCIVWSKIFGN